MENSEYTKLFAGNFIFVQRLKTELENIGITPIIKDESESGRLAGFGSPIPGHQQVYVSNEEFSKAEEILNNVKSEMEL